MNAFRDIIVSHKYLRYLRNCDVEINVCSDWLHHDRYHGLFKMYKFGAETHLGGGGMSTFIFPSVAYLFEPTFIARTALTKGPQRF